MHQRQTKFNPQIPEIKAKYLRIFQSTSQSYTHPKISHEHDKPLLTKNQLKTQQHVFSRFN